MTAPRPEVKSRRPQPERKPEAPVQRPARPADRERRKPAPPRSDVRRKIARNPAGLGFDRFSGPVRPSDFCDSRPIALRHMREARRAVRARRAHACRIREHFRGSSGSIGFPGRTGRPIFATADRSRGSCARGAPRRSGSPGPRLPDSRAFLRASGSSGFCGDGTVRMRKRRHRSDSGRTPCADHGAFPPGMLKGIGGRPAAKSIV